MIENAAFAVEVKDLHYSYKAVTSKRKSPKDLHLLGPKEALKGLSFRAPLGKITGLLGPNGSGKSTTFKIISTQAEASSGDAFILGHSVKREASLVRSFLGVTFQSPSLDPWLSVYENLSIQASMFSLTGAKQKQRILQLVERFSLGEKLHDRVQTLSGGWARRVELAKAILHEPKVLLLDEPTTGLDPLAKKNFWEELKTLSKQGVSILVTTHMMDEAELCDELVFMSEGVLAASGEAEKLRSELGADIVWLGLESISSAEAKIKNLFPEAKFRAEEKRLRIETKQALELLDYARKEFGSNLKSLSWAKPDLADVYFSKTGKDFYQENLAEAL